MFTQQGDYFTPTLTYEKMPSGAKMYQPTISAAKADALKPNKMSAMELLMRYLEMDGSDKLFAAHAHGISLSLLEPTKAASSIDFINWNDVTGKVNGQTHYKRMILYSREHSLERGFRGVIILIFTCMPEFWQLR